MYEDGTKVYGFRYGYTPTNRIFKYIQEMEKFVGEIGTVVSSNINSTSLIFSTGNRFSYPTEMIKDHLVNEEPEIDLKELLTQIKSL